jgi:hypothetical protein
MLDRQKRYGGEEGRCSRAARSVVVLVAEFDLVTMRLLDANAGPVGLHLFGDDHRQAGADAGSHLYFQEKGCGAAAKLLRYAT